MQKDSLYCILFLHQTTTIKRLRVAIDRLYCILFLHQTTTLETFLGVNVSCIASSFYIKPQPHGDSQYARECCIASSFYIKPQHIVADADGLGCCIASSFYIKPQLVLPATSIVSCCIASSFYIKPQPECAGGKEYSGCIASSFYIKPQRPFTVPYFPTGCIASSFYIKPQPRTPDTLIFGHLTASRHDTKRGGVHRGSRFDAVFTFSTNIRKIIFTEIRRCMSVQRAGARLRSDSSEANI